MRTSSRVAWIIHLPSSSRSHQSVPVAIGAGSKSGSNPLHLRSAPQPLRGVPAGRGRGAAGVVRRHPAPDRWLAATVAAAPGMRIGSDERRRPSKRGGSMIDREPLPRSDNSGAQASECRCGQPRGAARAAGGLLYQANRRMIVVQEPANGESPFISPKAACSRQAVAQARRSPSLHLFYASPTTLRPDWAERHDAGSARKSCQPSPTAHGWKSQ